ncbi:MAG: hypothetical protein ACK5JT_05090 [Hyphomicrobiaceae bacterium]
MTAPASTEADETDRAALALLRSSLALWGVDASATPLGGGAIRIDAETTAMTIARAPASLPFRWLVRLPERERAASSLVGVLRIVRGALDPHWRPSRARIAALSAPFASP